MRDLLTKTIIAWESLAGNYIWKQFQRLDNDFMTSRSTGRLERSSSDKVGNVFKVRIE